MKRYLSYIIISALACACSLQGIDSPYEQDLCEVQVTLQYPAGHESEAREGVGVLLEEVNLAHSYSAVTGSDGVCRLRVPSGLYNFRVSDITSKAIYNGTLPNVKVLGGSDYEMSLTYSKRGTLVFREVYCGGCQKLPETGTYQTDKYVIIHNNDLQTAYLDSLCFATLVPANATASNPWGGIQEDFAPVYMTIWQFGGDGHTFPLESGADAVLVVNGAIDHTVQYPLSVNLNNADYFVCYNNIYFPNTSYHPAPGDKIRQDHILEALCKLNSGSVNAYPFSVNSPTALLIKARGTTMQEFLLQEGTVEQVPGSTLDKTAKIPWEWILDGVEVFTASGSCNKRLRDDVDAGFVRLRETGMGRSLVRRVDEELSAKYGYEVLQDTNNSSSDFYESDKATLHVGNE